MNLIGMDYDENNLVTINDKLNYLLIHESPDYKANLSDKIKVREYTKKILGKDINVPILKIYNNENEINLEELPNKFVLKCNHASGLNILCNDKTKFNLIEAKVSLSKWIKRDYGYGNNEFQYLNIERKIFAETYLKDNIIDYKIYCFNGNPKFIRVQKSMPDKITKINNYYNLNWTLNDIETGIGNKFIRRPDIIFEKPKYLNLMIEYAKKLSTDFSFVRVDLYEVEDIIYLGEMTFTPSNTLFDNKNYNQSLYLGKLLNINKF